MKKERIARLVSARKLGGALLSLLMLVGLASCGKGDPNTLTLEVKPELRELGNFMSIESKEAVITLNEFTDDGEPRLNDMKRTGEEEGDSVCRQLYECVGN